MIRITTLMTSYMRKLFKLENTKNLQVEVPMTCKNKADKQDVIFVILNFLGHKIKIEDYE